MPYFVNIDTNLFNEEKICSLNDPRTASATRALLRLLPCHRIYLYPTRSGTSDIPGSPEVTGGEYRTRERIHRGIADPRLLAIPAS